MSKQSLTAFSEELLEIMPRLMRGLFRKHTDSLGQGKITLPQFLSLDLINRKGALKMKDIAKELRISFPAVTGLINRLVKMKLASRLYDEKDRRVIYITLTSSGKKMIDEISSTRVKAVKDIFGKLSDKERADYLRILRKVMRVIYPKK